MKLWNRSNTHKQYNRILHSYRINDERFYALSELVVRWHYANSLSRLAKLKYHFTITWNYIHKTNIIFNYNSLFKWFYCFICAHLNLWVKTKLPFIVQQFANIFNRSTAKNVDNSILLSMKWETQSNLWQIFIDWFATTAMPKIAI